MEPLPSPDPAAEPDGFVVEVEPGDRIHFLDWGGGAGTVTSGSCSSTGCRTRPGRGRPSLVGCAASGTSSRWTSAVTACPTPRPTATTAPTFAADVIAVAEGSGLLAAPGDRVVLAGHGFGAIVAAWAAVELGDRCAGLVLVDGGWESLEAASGMDVDEFLRGLDEPPEVMRSMAAFLADRAAFDPATWDADQERAARATVVETHAGKVVPSTRPHAVEASVRAMFRYDPLVTLPARAGAGRRARRGRRRGGLAGDGAGRGVRCAGARPGWAPIRVVSFGHDGHNLMRYRPEAVCAAILSVAGEGAG